MLSSITLAAAPACLSNAVTDIYVNDIRLTALIDTGSSENYLSHSVVAANKWSVYPSHQKVTMASTNYSSFTLGYCIVSIRFKDQYYRDVKLFVLNNLCTDVLLGHSFLKLHHSVELPFLVQIRRFLCVIFWLWMFLLPFCFNTSHQTVNQWLQSRGATLWPMSCSSNLKSKGSLKVE